MNNKIWLIATKYSDLKRLVDSLKKNTNKIFNWMKIKALSF